MNLRFETFRRRCASLATTLTAACMLAVPMSALATELKMASGYPDGNYLTLTVRDFIADAAKRSGGSLKIELHNNQTLVKLPEMMRAAQTNQVAIADVRLGNYGNQDPVYIVDAIPFVAGDYDSALKLWQASKPYLVDSFDRLRDEGGRLLSVGLHCRIVGRPGRAPALDRFLAHVRRHDDVWVATRAEIARHWRAVHPRTTEIRSRGSRLGQDP